MDIDPSSIPESEWDLYLLSFIDRDADKYLGIVYIRAPTGLFAIDLSWQLGLNPGGEVLAAPLTKEFLTGCQPCVTGDCMEVLLDYDQGSNLIPTDRNQGITFCTRCG